MKFANCVVSIALLAVAARAGGIGQVSAWDVIREAGHLQQTAVLKQNGLAKGSPYGQVQKTNSYTTGIGLGFDDATSLRWVSDCTYDRWTSSGSSSSWVYYGKSVATKQTSVGACSQVVEFYDEDTMSRAEYFYNSKGVCTLSVNLNYDLSASTPWTNSKRTVAAYDANDSLKSIKSYVWDTVAHTFSAQPQNADSFAYNAGGQLVFSASFTAASARTDTTRYFYDPQGNVQTAVTVSPRNDSMRVVTLYPITGTQVQVARLRLRDSTTWKNYDSSVAEYDGNGHQTAFSSFYWNSSVGQYSKRTRLVMTYASTGQVSSFIRSIPNSGAQWVDDIRGSYGYNSTLVRSSSCPDEMASGSAGAWQRSDPLLSESKTRTRASVLICDGRGREVGVRASPGSPSWRHSAKGVHFVSTASNNQAVRWLLLSR